MTIQDRKWLDELTIELRLRDVSGAAIGDALASVKGFLADSGERAEAAFGTPVEYAASLELPASPSARSVKGTTFRSVAGMMAFMAFALGRAGDPHSRCRSAGLTCGSGHSGRLPVIVS